MLDETGAAVTRDSTSGLTRRTFLHSAGAVACTLALSRLVPGCGSQQRPSQPVRPKVSRIPPPPAPAYRSWEDLYRAQWQWDAVVKVTHTRTNCIAACSWNAFVRDGVVLREEQNTVYRRSHPDVPDMNPRGCQKGACYSRLMYEPSRLKYPLRRVGPRGSGRWQRIDWDTALREVADHLLDAALDGGPDCVIYDHGTTNIDFGPGTAAEMRFFFLYGATTMDSWAGVGDLPMGAIQCWGHFNADGSSDDWFNSDYILIWIGNPVYTRIPDVHFMWEARYRGATVVSIAPDYNASSIHADLWLNPRIGSDAALALSMAQVIVAENRFDKDYVLEQTDLPFLVRTDTGCYLREADLRRNGKDDVFYVWDQKTGRPAPAPGSQGSRKQTLRLHKLAPALEGRFRVAGADGNPIEVEPLFERLRRHLQAYEPQRTQNITGIHPEVVRRVARGLARARSAMIFASWGACKHYHSDLAQRGMCLLMALTGNEGRRGGGLRIGAWYGVDALNYIANEIQIPFYQRILLRFFRPSARDFEGFMDQMTRQRPFTATLPFLYVHGGMNRVVDRSDFQDPALPRPVAEYTREASEKGWMPVSPPPERPPRVYFYSGVNMLRRWPVPQLAREHLWPKLKLIVNVNFRMCSTGLESDLLLPAAGYYEKAGIKYTQSLVPYVIFGDRAVPPLGESKNEWEIMTLLAQKLEQRAKERGIARFTDAYGIERDYARFYSSFTKNGRWGPQDNEKVLDEIIRNSPVTRGFTWEDARREGALPIRDYGHLRPSQRHLQRVS